MANISAVKVEEFIENGQPTNEVTIRTKSGNEIVIFVSSEGWAIEVNGEVVRSANCSARFLVFPRVYAHA